MEPLISIVIPTFNRRDHVLDSVRTALGQSYKNVEVLVVDDCSTDDTVEVLTAITDARLRVLQLERNSGGGAARNYGIDAAKGAYIAFLDSDDAWHPTKLEKQMERLAKAQDQSVIVYTNLVLDFGDKKETILNPPMKPGQNACEYLFLNWSRAYIQTSSWLMLTEIARAVRFDGSLRLHQDWDFLIRAETLGFGFLLVEEPLTVWKVDVRTDRISLATDRLDRSMAWLAKWESHIGVRGVKAFKARRAPELAPRNLSRSLLWVLEGAMARTISPRPSLRQARRCIARKFLALAR